MCIYSLILQRFDLYSVILFCCFYGGNRGKPTGKIHFSRLRVRSASLAGLRMRICHWYTLRLDRASGVQKWSRKWADGRHVEWPHLRSEYYRFLLGHGNESHRFASTARMPQNLPPKIFIFTKKFIISTNKAKLNKISNKIVYWLQWNEHIAVCLSSISTFIWNTELYLPKWRNWHTYLQYCDPVSSWYM
jgi:hypothetical protein